MCVATYLNLPINGINNDWHITHEALCLSTVESFSIRYMKKTYQYYDIYLSLCPQHLLTDLLPETNEGSRDIYC